MAEDAAAIRNRLIGCFFHLGVRDRADAEDGAHDVLLKWIKLGQPDVKDSYWYTAARNHVTTKARRARIVQFSPIDKHVYRLTVPDSTYNLYEANQILALPEAKAIVAELHLGGTAVRTRRFRNRKKLRARISR